MKIRIVLPDLVSASYFPALASVELGFMAKEGLDASIHALAPIPKAFERLREGEFDFVAGTAHAAMYAFKNWEGCKVLAALSQNMYWFLVLRSDIAATRGDLRVLKGLRIAANTGPADGLKQMLIEGGIDPERDLEIKPLPGSAGVGLSFGVRASKALEAGTLDGFWANGMGAERAVRKGVGKILVDARRGDGPPKAKGFTFASFVTTQRNIDQNAGLVSAALRALVRTQQALIADPNRASEVGKRVFPAEEAAWIAELIHRDAPFYSPAVSKDAVESLNDFGRRLGLISGRPTYEQVVATEFQQLWEN